jgi:histidyl-tRNA synthetase
MFRHERPQAGRLRQFHQFGVESFGTSDPRADVEVISLLWRFLSELRLPGLTLELNSLGLADDRAGYISQLVAYLKDRESQLCGNCQRRIVTNPLRVLDCKVPHCRAATEDAPRLIDFLSPAAREHFDHVLADLQALEIPSTINPRLVRGLDYYCLTAFELTCSHLGAQNAVGAGGRYDALVASLGGPATPAVGFAEGLERIALLLPDAVLPVLVRPIYVAAFGEKGSRAGLMVLDGLRTSGIGAEMDVRSTTLKAHLRQADRLGVRYTVILGDDEATNGAVLIRDMTTKMQESIPITALPDFLVKRLHSIS